MDLSEQMRSPSLALEPPPGLADVVRGRARRVRARRRVASGALGLVAVVGLGTVVLSTPSVTDAPLAADDTYGIDDATSSVEQLAPINGGDVVAYWKDDAPCVAAVRVKRDPDCGPGVSPQTADLFPYVFTPNNDSLRIDDRQLLAGVVRGDVAEVQVVLSDNRRLVARVRSGPGFLLPLFSAELPRGATLLQLRALDARGLELGQRP